MGASVSVGERILESMKSIDKHEDLEVNRRLLTESVGEGSSTDLTAWVTTQVLEGCPKKRQERLKMILRVTVQTLDDRMRGTCDEASVNSILRIMREIMKELRLDSPRSIIYYFDGDIPSSHSTRLTLWYNGSNRTVDCEDDIDATIHNWFSHEFKTDYVILKNLGYCLLDAMTGQEVPLNSALKDYAIALPVASSSSLFGTFLDKCVDPLIIAMSFDLLYDILPYGAYDGSRLIMPFIDTLASSKTLHLNRVDGAVYPSMSYITNTPQIRQPMGSVTPSIESLIEYLISTSHLHLPSKWLLSLLLVYPSVHSRWGQKSLYAACFNSYRNKPILEQFQAHIWDMRQTDMPTMVLCHLSFGNSYMRSRASRYQISQIQKLTRMTREPRDIKEHLVVALVMFHLSADPNSMLHTNMYSSIYVGSKYFDRISGGSIIMMSMLSILSSDPKSPFLLGLVTSTLSNLSIDSKNLDWVLCDRVLHLIGRLWSSPSRLLGGLLDLVMSSLFNGDPSMLYAFVRIGFPSGPAPACSLNSQHVRYLQYLETTIREGQDEDPLKGLGELRYKGGDMRGRRFDFVESTGGGEFFLPLVLQARTE